MSKAPILFYLISFFRQAQPPLWCNDTLAPDSAPPLLLLCDLSPTISGGDWPDFPPPFPFAKCRGQSMSVNRRVFNLSPSKLESC